MTISSVLIILVAQVFLTQNQFYTRAVGRNLADDAVRTAAEFLGSELRNAPMGGVVAATSRRAVLRSAIAVGGVCDRGGGSRLRIYMPGISTADTTEAAGYAVRDANGDWSYNAETWGSLLDDIGEDPADDCESEGVDTTNAMNDFVEFRIGGQDVGDLIMVYRELEYEIAESDLDPGMLAIYRGENGGDQLELATGLMTGSQFEYLVGSTWLAAPSGAQMDSISEIRVTVQATGRGDSITSLDYSTTVSFRVPLQGG